MKFPLLPLVFTALGFSVAASPVLAQGSPPQVTGEARAVNADTIAVGGYWTNTPPTGSAALDISNP